MYALHSRNGLLSTAQGRIPDDLTLDVSKPIQEKQALDVALADRKLTPDDFKGDAKLPKGELVVTSVDGNLLGSSFRLAYYFDFLGKQPADFVRVYVDANASTVLKREPLLSACFGHPDHKHTEHCSHTPIATETATPTIAASAPKIAGTFTPVNYSNNRYLPAGQTTRTFEVDPFGSDGSLLTASTNVGQALDTRNDTNNDLAFNDAQLTNGSLNWATNQQTATTTHWIAYQAYQYFRNVLDPFNDNNGTDGQGRIANILIQPQLNGAFWDQPQRLMLIGRNPGTGRVLSAIDIVAHEYGHGMSRRLIGGNWANGISRSLDEGFSDIIGTAVERHILPDGTPQQWNWTLGEDAWFVRNMANPGQFGMPEWFEGPGWDFNGTQPVHHNSAVLSRWFHALVTGNTPRANFPINGIGFNDAIQIVYKGLDSYIMANATYADVRDAMRLAARDEFGGCSPQQRSVIAAWNAVNLPFNQPCDPLYCDKDLFVTAPSSTECGQTVAINSSCNSPNNTACSPSTTSFDVFNQAGAYIGSGTPFNIVAPSTVATLQYTVKLSGGLYCYAPTRNISINVNCTSQPPTSCSIPTNACYTIQVQKTGQFLQSMGDGNIYQQGANNQNNQIWKVEDRGSGRVSFITRDGTNRAIGANSGNFGEALTLGAYVGNGQQDWLLACNPVDNTLWRVFYPNNNNNTWDLKDFGNQPNLQIWGNTSEPFYDYRSFRFQPVTCPNTSTPPTGSLSFQTVSYDCNTGVWQWQYTGGNGSQIETWCPGAFGNRLISANNIQSVTLDANLRNGTNFNITAVQSGQTYTYTFTSSCNGNTPPPTTGALTIVAPTFSCATGDLTINTTGGNGGAIEYQIPGLRGWGGSPTMNVPSWQRNGITFTLQARQSGVEATPYSFQTSCGSGRLAVYDDSQPTVNLIVSPNPTAGLARVRYHLGFGKQAILSIESVSGKTIYSIPVTGLDLPKELDIDLGQQAAGMYLVRLQGEMIHQVVKLLLQR